VKPRPSTLPALEKPRQPGRIRAVVLAVLVHAAFFGLIVFGVTWQSRPTPPVEAELWDKLPPVAKATPKAEPKVEPPKPEPPPPKPEPPKPEPPKPEVKPEPAKPDPAIALKAEKEKRERLEQEKREHLEKQRAEEKKKQEQEKAEKKKREKEEADRKKREDDKRRKDEEIAKQAAEQARVEAAKARASEIDIWKKKIQDKIRSRANVPDTVTGHPVVEVHIRVLPGGEVLDIAITKRSGNPVYDSSIERGIRSASPLPLPPVDSELFPQFRELNLIFRHER
jgi:colicin import membrane protein